jgi:hypothetical protein
LLHKSAALLHGQLEIQGGSTLVLATGRFWHEFSTNFWHEFSTNFIATDVTLIDYLLQSIIT